MSTKKKPSPDSIVREIKRKAMARDLRFIYEASTEEEESAALEEFSEKWEKRCPHVSVSWRKKWGRYQLFSSILRRSAR